ncbi:hypothetical protein, partial [Herbiconiux daphne]
QQKVENAFNGNYELAVKTREQLRSAEQPELYESAQRLTENLRDYNSMATEVANGKPINTERLEMKAREITRDSTALGLSDKFKGINGETGVFNPAIDLQAWHNFNTRTRGMHPTAPKGQFKDMVAAKEIGIEGFDVTKPATWTKPIKAVVSGATSSMKATQSMARGAAMARGAKAPTRSTSPEGEMVASEEHIQNALRRNDPTNATRESEAALKESG